jgi:hypothetical protein
MKTNRLLLILITGFLTLLASGTEKSHVNVATATATAAQSAPSFTVCLGTYALCTTAQCKVLPSPPGSTPTYSCSCDVVQGYSAGAKSCAEVPPVTPPKAGDKIPSRYYPVKSMAVCENNRPWAMCLDSHCTVDKGLKTATCNCSQAPPPTQPYVIVGDSFSESTCTTNIWSSATVEDVIQITGFLQDSKQLKPFPITIVGVGATQE